MQICARRVQKSDILVTEIGHFGLLYSSNFQPLRFSGVGKIYIFIPYPLPTKTDKKIQHLLKYTKCYKKGSKKEDFEFLKTLSIQLVAGAGFEPTTFGL